VIECQVDCAFVQKSHAVRKELVGDREFERLAG
jgi:hypothetical protein